MRCMKRTCSGSGRTGLSSLRKTGVQTSWSKSRMRLASSSGENRFTVWMRISARAHQAMDDWQSMDLGIRTYTLLRLRVEHALQFCTLLFRCMAPRCQYRSVRGEKRFGAPTHQVDDQLLRLEILLHLHPHAIRLELLHPLLLVCRLLEHRLLDLRLRELVPLQLLHLRARRDRHVLARREHVRDVVPQHRVTRRTHRG